MAGRSQKCERAISNEAKCGQPATRIITPRNGFPEWGACDQHFAELGDVDSRQVHIVPGGLSDVRDIEHGGEL